MNAPLTQEEGWLTWDLKSDSAVIQANGVRRTGGRWRAFQQIRRFQSVSWCSLFWDWQVVWRDWYLWTGEERGREFMKFSLDATDLCHQLVQTSPFPNTRWDHQSIYMHITVGSVCNTLPAQRIPPVIRGSPPRGTQSNLPSSSFPSQFVPSVMYSGKLPKWATFNFSVWRFQWERFSIDAKVPRLLKRWLNGISLRSCQ